MLRYVIFVCLITLAVNAEEIINSIATPKSETIIYGSATNQQGTENSVLIEQPADSGNPLGNPLAVTLPTASPDVKADSSTTSTTKPSLAEPALGVAQNSPQNPDITEMSPEQMNNEIQNRLYEEGDRVYDIQSYPLKDIEYMQQNGQDNAITNYPAY